MRWVSDTDWVLGLVGRVNTQGTGVNALQDLLGFDTRHWTAEISPLVGWRRWPVHLEMRYFVEVFSDYGGPATEFRASLPLGFDRGWFVPSVRYIHSSADRNRYYYGIATDEIQGIDPYDPGSSSNLKVKLGVGWALSEKWLLSGSIGYEWLASEVTDSPAVARDALWSGTVGIAYNSDVFRGLSYDEDSYGLRGFRLQAGIYSNNTDSRIIRLPSGGGPADRIELEDLLGINQRDSVLHVDGVYRFARFHRLQVGFFELGRESDTTLLQDLQIGDEIFSTGTSISVESDLETWRLAYGFSLINDPQKELGVLAGVHWTDVNTRVVAPDTGQLEESEFDTPLPVIGAFGSIALGEKTDLAARIEFFRMEFDAYEGSLDAVYLGISHSFTDTIGAGIGYNYYAMNLDSPDPGLRGSIEFRHHGPIGFVTFSF